MTDDQMCAMLTLLGWVPQISLPRYAHTTVGWDAFNHEARTVIAGRVGVGAKWVRLSGWFPPNLGKVCAWTDVPPALVRSFYEYLMRDCHD
jgi:hypothetical protein